MEAFLFAAGFIYLTLAFILTFRRPFDIFTTSILLVVGLLMLVIGIARMAEPVTDIQSRLHEERPVEREPVAVVPAREP